MILLLQYMPCVIRFFKSLEDKSNTSVLNQKKMLIVLIRDSTFKSSWIKRSRNKKLFWTILRVSCIESSMKNDMILKNLTVDNFHLN